MATKLYVGNLSETTTEQSLRELFDAFGPVTEVAVLHQGYGFVHYRSPEDAEAARQALNETVFEGAHITVQISRTKGHGYKGRGGSSRDRGPPPSREERGRGRYSEYSSRSDRGHDRGYDRGYDHKYDDYHRGSSRYSDGYPDGGRYRGGGDYRDYYDRDGYGYPPRRDRSPTGYLSREYYRDSHYDRDPYRDDHRDRYSRHPRY